MSDSANSSDLDATWLQTTLSELLTAPHISFRSPPLAGIRMGPGPIDLFTTRFNNTFTPDVKAVVAGQEVDRDGLKEKLLALQKHYHPDAVQSRSCEKRTIEEKPGEVLVSFNGASKDLGEYEVSTAAVLVGTSANRMISSINLDGKPELFAKPAT